MSRRLGPLVAFVTLFAALAFIATDAEARSRVSIGSRGMRTYSAPAPTATAPGAARPIERSMTEPGATAAQPAPAPTTSGGFFGRPGLLGGLAAGFLGAGLIGLLLGHGFLGGLGGLASIIGLLLQVALVVIVARLLWAWWQRRNQPAFAGGPSLRDVAPTGTGVPAVSAGGGTRQSSDADEIGLASGDFDAFERLLGEVQSAYGAEDLAALRSRVTPEMLSYFSEELSENASRGVINQLSDIHLLQGDLSEAWREAEVEYATVAMRYALVDRMIERSSGRVVEGETSPQEVTELWTFMRVRGGNWLLSAIQQV